MIGRLRGVPIADEGDSLVLDVGGVGYELTVPLGVLGRAEKHEGGAVTLFVHTHVREDALSLFGFASEDERMLFRTLLGIASVGPKTAVAVLSAFPVNDLARAIAAKDVAAITRVPGIGKKTAERLVLELRDKLEVRPGGPKSAAQPIASEAPPSDRRSLLLGALTRMGYKSAEAERAIASLGEVSEETPLADLLREALHALSK